MEPAAAAAGAIAGPGATEGAPPSDWARLPDDMLLTVMNALEIPDLLSTGAVCSSWRPAYFAARRVRLPITDASPCLLYSCAADDANTATIYSPSSDVTFKVRLPDPAFRTRHVVGSGHGWVVAADEASNLQALNPLTGAQVDLPPVTGLRHVEPFFDDERGGPMYNHYYDEPDIPSPLAYRPQELRLFLYHRVFLSCSPSAGSECVVLLMHRPEGTLSFAHLGDDRWTPIESIQFLQWQDCFRNAVYNKNDGLFYLVYMDGSILTLDLNGPSSPVVAMKVLGKVTQWDDPTKYIVMTPHDGDILQLWRFIDNRYDTIPIHVPPELAHEVLNPYEEMHTDGMELYKVNLDEQKLISIDCLENYALFLGFNSTLLVSTEDYPMLKPNCAYFTDDNYEVICVNKYNRRDIGVWNFKTKTVESLGDVQFAHPWLNFPSPIWISPSLC